MPPMPPMPAGGAMPEWTGADTSPAGADTKAATVDSGTSETTTSGDDSKGEASNGASDSGATSDKWYSTSGRQGGGATAASISWRPAERYTVGSTI